MHSCKAPGECWKAAWNFTAVAGGKRRTPGPSGTRQYWLGMCGEWGRVVRDRVTVSLFILPFNLLSPQMDFCDLLILWAAGDGGEARSYSFSAFLQRTLDAEIKLGFPCSFPGLIPGPSPLKGVLSTTGPVYLTFPETVPTTQTSSGRGSSAAGNTPLQRAAGISVAREDLKDTQVSSHHS